MPAPAPKPLDPSRLDVAAFAANAGVLEGSWPLSALERLAEDRMQGRDEVEEGEAEGRAELEALAPASPPTVTWSARGETRPVRVGAPEIWLRLSAQARISRTCQRCLQPVGLEMAIERSFRFVATESQAAEIDAQAEEEVLVLTRSLNLQELVEDELLLDLPLVPRHEVCPRPLALPTDSNPAALSASEHGAVSTAEPEAQAPHPFAALAALKRKPQDS